jgi:hypothetical protein
LPSASWGLGRSFWAKKRGADAYFSRCCAVCACGTMPRAWPPASVLPYQTECSFGDTFSSNPQNLSLAATYRMSKNDTVSPPRRDKI